MCTSDIPVVLTGHNGGKSFIVKSQLFSQCFSHLGEKTVYTKIAAMVCGIGLLVLLSALVPASGFAGVTPRSSIPASTAGPSICPAGALERSRGVSLRGLGGGRRGFRLVMAEGEGDRMAELVEKRDALLEEKAELLRKRRNELSVDISRLEREQQQTAVEAKKAQPKPRDTEEVMCAAPHRGNAAGPLYTLAYLSCGDCHCVCAWPAPFRLVWPWCIMALIPCPPPTSSSLSDAD
jgi:hypothetical protein